MKRIRILLCFRNQITLLVTICLVVASVLYKNGTLTLFTPDQKGYQYYTKKKYNKAVALFVNPMFKGEVLFRQGSFKQAAEIYSGLNSAESAFNHGNSLVMLGKYQEAVEKYKSVIALRKDWQAPKDNLIIAIARAKMLKKEGGDMTGGEMGADDIVFTEGKKTKTDQTEIIDNSIEMSDAEMRTMWLRQVATKPSDFLRAKFAYQYAIKQISHKDNLNNNSRVNK